mgnify:CR=1 FL=1
MDGIIRSHVAVASDVMANVLVASGHLMNYFGQEPCRPNLERRTLRLEFPAGLLTLGQSCDKSLLVVTGVCLCALGPCKPPECSAISLQLFLPKKNV